MGQAGYEENGKETAGTKVVPFTLHAQLHCRGTSNVGVCSSVGLEYCTTDSQRLTGSESSMYNGLYDGGLSGMVYSFIWTTIGFLPIVASLAELASMSPTSGG